MIFELKCNKKRLSHKKKLMLSLEKKKIFVWNLKIHQWNRNINLQSSRQIDLPQSHSSRSVQERAELRQRAQSVVRHETLRRVQAEHLSQCNLPGIGSHRERMDWTWLHHAEHRRMFQKWTIRARRRLGRSSPSRAGQSQRRGGEGSLLPVIQNKQADLKTNTRKICTMVIQELERKRLLSILFNKGFYEPDLALPGPKELFSNFYHKKHGKIKWTRINGCFGPQHHDHTNETLAETIDFTLRFYIIIIIIFYKTGPTHGTKTTQQNIKTLINIDCQTMYI